MLYLPPVTVSGGRWVFPIADRSATMLVDMALVEEGKGVRGLLCEAPEGPFRHKVPDTFSSPEADPSFVDVLGADPPLVLWAVCQAEARRSLRPGSLLEVVQWLRPRLVGLLRWDGPKEPPAEGPDSRSTLQYADLVAAALQVADLAAILAAAQGQEAAERAYLEGLLWNAGDWLAMAGSGPGGPSTEVLPPWLVESPGGAAAGPVAEARDILSGKSPVRSPELDPEACRVRAEEGRRRWLEAVPGPGARLPVLAARLTRLRELEDRFQAALETAKLEAMAEFAAGAGHEINNPLAIIGGRAQLFLKDEKDPERRRDLALINAQVKRAHEMIADVHLFARPPKPEPTEFDLAALVERLIEEWAPQAAERAIAIGRSGDPGPLVVRADAVQVHVALAALCKNSLEAIGHDGRVEIALAAAPDEVEIRVSDDGPGITPQQRPHLFDPFYSARQAGRGLGLGLSKCWRIVANHGGRIEVQSEPGHGATFRILLPRTCTSPSTLTPDRS